MTTAAPATAATTFTEIFAPATGHYVFTTQRDGSVYTHSTLEGWTIRFRRGLAFRGKGCSLQSMTYRSPSLFGALRKILRDGRMWSGREFFLEIVSVQPILRAHYEFPAEDD